MSLEPMIPDEPSGLQEQIQILQQQLEAQQALLNNVKTKLQLQDTQANIQQTENALQHQDLQAYVDALLVGSVTAFAMPNAPDGWLVCKGQAVSRTEYARLFARIGTSFGEGDGSSTFNVPELCGRFIRGWDKAGKHDHAGDSDNKPRSFGSFQADQMQTHTHIDKGHTHKGSISKAGKHAHRTTLSSDGSHIHVGSISYSGKHYHSAPANRAYYTEYDSNGKLILSAAWGDSNLYDSITLRKAEKIFGNRFDRSHSLSVTTEKLEPFYDDGKVGVANWSYSGEHSHSLEINAEGEHTHQVYIDGNGSHTHVFENELAQANLSKPIGLDRSPLNSGNENRPANIALLFCIKY